MALLFFHIIVQPQVQDVTTRKGVSDGFPSMGLSWTAVSDESGINYTVWYSTSSGTEIEPPSGASIVEGITGISTKLSGLEKGTRYYIWVAAVSSDGQGSYSTRVSQTTFSGIACFFYYCIRVYRYCVYQVQVTIYIVYTCSSYTTLKCDANISDICPKPKVKGGYHLASHLSVV